MLAVNVHLGYAISRSHLKAAPPSASLEAGSEGENQLPWRPLVASRMAFCRLYCARLSLGLRLGNVVPPLTRCWRLEERPCLK